MKSIKKRFKRKLQAIEQSAAELGLVCVEINLLEPMSTLAGRVTQLCDGVRLRVEELNKIGFVEHISRHENLVELDGLADEDVISVLEGRFSSALADCKANQLNELLQQLLEKLEKRHADMLKNIRQLGKLLTDAV